MENGDKIPTGLYNKIGHKFLISLQEHFDFAALHGKIPLAKLKSKMKPNKQNGKN